VDARGSQAKIDSFHVGGYAGGIWGGTRLNVGATLSWNDVATTRGISFAGFSDRSLAQYKSHQVHVFAEGGHRVALGTAGLEPFAGIAWARLSTDSFTETANTAGLQAPKQKDSAAWTTVGLRGDVPLGAGLKAYGSAAWRRTIDGELPAAILSFPGGAPFTVRGTPLDKDTALLSAGLTVVAGDAQINIGYSGSIGSRRQDHGGRASLSLRF
jgi:outer membrane autotransporter protein